MVGNGWEWLGMVGKWLGNIQPMCSAPGAFLAGAFFFLKSRALFIKSVFLGVFRIKPHFFYNKKSPTPGFVPEIVRLMGDIKKYRPR